MVNIDSQEGQVCVPSATSVIVDEFHSLYAVFMCFTPMWVTVGKTINLN